MPDFKVLFNASPNSYVLLDSDLNIVEANEAYLRATGKKREDIVGRNMFEVFPANPEDQDASAVEQLRASFERVLSERRRDSLALIRYAIPGEASESNEFDERYWSATHTPILDEQGEVAFILQHTVDVTRVHQFNAALQEAEQTRNDIPSEQVEEGIFRRAQAVQEASWTIETERRRLRRLFEQAPGFVAFLKEPEHVFELTNKAYNQLVGHREIVGKPVREALPEIEGQGFFELLDRVRDTGKPFVGREMEVQLQREPGAALDDVYVDFVYQPVTRPDGSVTGIFVQGHDVTEQKRTKDELRRYQDHLEDLVQERTRELEESQAALQQAQKMEAIGKLTGGVAHDFNNLLQIIGGNVQFLQQDIDTNEQARRRLQTAARAVERGAKLTSQLLAFARRQPLEPSVVDPAQLLVDMNVLLRRSLNETIEIEVSTEEDLWNTLVDPHQLENVILNLAINARDAMDGKGRLTIEVANTVLDEDYADAHPDVTPGRYVCLAVSDSGCGMPPEDVERAFEPFFTTKSEEEGTGLGLSMVYGFVKQSGGHVKIYSEVGTGTTVKIYLPRTLEEVEEGDEAVEASIQGGSETVLVVEDDADVRATAVEMLADLGYRVLQAADGEGALAVIQSGVAIDLLFTDVVMPGPVLSPDLARRAREHLPDLEVLFTSGYTENALHHHGQLDPDVNLLSKPYTRQELAQKIRRILGTSPQQTNAASSASVKEGAPSGPRTPPSSLRILLVEDDEAIQVLVDATVSKLGHSAVTVSSAEEAIEVFEEGVFDVLFTDVTLPGESGVSLARKLTSRQESLKVIVATGRGNVLKTEDGEDMTEAVLLSKPYDVADIERALNQVIARSEHNDDVSQTT